VTLLLPFAVLCYHLAVGRPGPRLRSYLIGTLVAVTLLMASTSTSLLGGQERTPFNRADPHWLDNGAKLAQVYGAYVWSYLLLAGALAVVLRRGESSAATALSGTAPPSIVSPSQAA
jgi:hypothetical protein